MKIAIASGKGGTGKSTVSTNLAYLISQEIEKTCLLDCDVEEPNCHIFLKPEFENTKKIYVQTPLVDKEKCIQCGKCAEVCQYNALAFVKGKVLVFQELCHGCGSCMTNCPANAISETGREVGELETGTVKSDKTNFSFAHGKTRIGEAMSPPLINSVKDWADNQSFCVQLLDCPPGTSCPMIAAIDGADFVILVTEPTPFGLYDLKLAVDVVRKMDFDFGIVINRSDEENDDITEAWAKEEGIKILTKIPDDRRIAECYSKGEIILEQLPEYKKAFEPLIALSKKVGDKKW